jgi:hypothetical protein
MQLQWLRPSRALIRLALPTSGLRATGTVLHPVTRITGDCKEWNIAVVKFTKVNWMLSVVTAIRTVAD